MSRIESLDSPRVAIPGVEMPLVKAAGLSLPELDTIGNNPKSRPEIRSRHIASRKFFFVLGDPGVESFWCFQRTALAGSPGSDLAGSLTGGEVGISFVICNFRNLAFDSNLGVQRRPVEAKRSLRVRQQLAPLSTFVVRVER